MAKYLLMQAAITIAKTVAGGLDATQWRAGERLCPGGLERPAADIFAGGQLYPAGGIQ